MAMQSALPASFSPDKAHETPFYIPATGEAARPRFTLKYGDTFLLLDNHGDIGSTTGNNDGLFHRDTRFLSYLSVLVDGVQPLLLGSNVKDDNTSLTADLTNPDMYFEDQLRLPKDTLHLIRTIFLWRDTAYQRVAIRNHGDQSITIQLTLLFDSDFADLFEIRGLHRDRRGTRHRRICDQASVALQYDGLDRQQRQALLRFEPTPDKLTVAAASYDITLASKASTVLMLTIGCGNPSPPATASFIRGLRALHQRRQADAKAAASVETSNDVLNEVFSRAAADLMMLTTDTAQGRYPYAGIPWYSTTFGRDGLITAMQMLWVDPGIAQGVLRRLAAYQARTTDAAADAQPGKILHEMRGGEMAALREIPFGLYYGSVDATPLFVILAGLYDQRTGDTETLAELWPAIEAALAWIDGAGDPDRDGFVEYHRADEQGLINQGWKDSHDAIFYADGELARGPIALVEVQAYVYLAKRLASSCATRLGMSDYARECARQADELAVRFDRAFWCPDINSYALALDGEKRRCSVRSSNAGHVLFTGIAPSHRVSLVADDLMRPQYFTGWGIRTIASTEARYNPMSYHNGSVWPHDNAIISLGLGRYGYKRSVERLFRGLVDAATYMDMRRLPELFCGFQRRRGRGPTHYPVACSPQAWSSASLFTLLEASLGMEFNPADNQIRLRSPCLPDFLDWIVLRNLRLRDGEIDLKVRRHTNDISVELLARRGPVQLSVVFG